MIVHMENVGAGSCVKIKAEWRVRESILEVGTLEADALI